MDCGRFLRADSVSLDKGRFDYARVLISTSSLEVVRVTEQILVDDVLWDIKIIEEWGFCLGEDACLNEGDDTSVLSSPDGDEVPDGFELDENVDLVADKIVREMVDAGEDEVNGDDLEGSVNLATSEPIVGIVAKEPVVSVNSKGVSIEVASLTNKVDNSIINGEVGAQGASAAQQQCSVGSVQPSSVRRPITPSGARSGHQVMVSRKRRVKSSLGSRDATGSGRSGPWSVDWLHNVQKGGIGLISSRKKRLKKSSAELASKGGGKKPSVVRKKAGGVLRHPVFTLKKVARLPSRDREEVMKVLEKSSVMEVLKQKVRNRQRQRERVSKSLEVNQCSNIESASVDSVNNDWKHWVTLQGKDKAIEEDIQGIRCDIGLNFAAAPINKLSVLSRSTKLNLGPVLSPREEGVGVVVGDV